MGLGSQIWYNNKQDQLNLVNCILLYLYYNRVIKVDWYDTGRSGYRTVGLVLGLFLQKRQLIENWVIII